MSRAALRHPSAYTAWFPASASAWRHLVSVAAAAGEVTREIAIDDLRFRVRNGGVPGYGELAREWGGDWTPRRVEYLVKGRAGGALPDWMDPMTREYLTKAGLASGHAWRTPAVQAELARQAVAADVRAYRKERDGEYRAAGDDR